MVVQRSPKPLAGVRFPHPVLDKKIQNSGFFGLFFMPTPITIFMVHGGMTFKSRRDYVKYLKTRDLDLSSKSYWSGAYLDKKLGRDFNVVRPRMPLSDNARYEDWKIFFERYLPLLKHSSILIGSSLGGIFLVKYFSEHKLAKPFKSLFLVAPPFDNNLPEEDLVGGFRLQSDLRLLEKNFINLHFLFSLNDDVVPPSQALGYARRLPQADIRILDNITGHFKESRFPEIIKMIQEDSKNFGKKLR